MPAELPPLIPREHIFGNPERTMPQLSPDGTLLAYIAPHEGVLNVWVRAVGAADDRVITRDTKRGIRMFFWAYDSRRIGYLQDADGDENWHVWLADLGSPAIRDLTPFLGAQAQVIARDHHRPNEILVSLNVRDERVHDVYRCDLSTGALTLEVENPGDVIGWVADADFTVRAAQAAMPDGGFQIRVRAGSDADWRPLITCGPDDEIGAHMFTQDGGSLYVSSSVDADTEQVRLVDTATGAEQTLAQHPSADAGGVLAHPTEHRVRAVSFTVDRDEWVVLDPSIEKDVEFLRTAHDGDFQVVNADLADRTWVVLYVQDRAPAAFYAYHRETAALEFLFTTRPALEGVTLAEMRPVRIPARDGLTLTSYLTLPPGQEERHLPLVLNVHGGPWARDTWGYDPEAQWLANRGYACLQVNFRGSAGFGKRFLHAGDREWAGKMHDDLLDAVAWAVNAGIADPARVAIYGGSYGGYAALVGATFTPDVFACAVDLVGPSSLATLIDSFPPYWAPLRRVFTLRVGDPETEREFLDSRSPLYRADQIRCPLLIAQGANDPRVKQAESEQIVEALTSAGKTVEYLLYEDEGHGFARPENRLSFYAAAERFLAAHIGGRCEA